MHATIRNLFLVALLGLTTGVAPSSAVAGSPPAAPLSAGAPAQSAALRFYPPELDLGEMLAGQPKTATLTLINTGAEAFTIAWMKGGCGCTTITPHPTGPIAAGASFSVEVTVDPGMRTGISLRKPVHVKLADGRVETMHVVGRVKTVIAVTPDQVEAVGSVAGAIASVTLASVDGAPFSVTGATPSGIVTPPQPTAASNRIELALDLEAWERAGRPSTVLLATDRGDARQVAVPIKFADAVAMFRLPTAALGRAREESAQDALVREIDNKIPTHARSAQFRMRLHRESGMLFVHGTESDLESVRSAVRSLPASSGVRESVPSPKG